MNTCEQSAQARLAQTESLCHNVNALAVGPPPADHGGCTFKVGPLSVSTVKSEGGRQQCRMIRETVLSSR